MLVVKRARFSTKPIDQAAMEQIGNSFIASQDARLARAQNIWDQPAKPLSPKYAARKSRRGRRPVRDWKFTGLLRSAIKILQLSANRVVVGLTDATADARLRANQRREPQFGVSPKNLNAILRVVERVRQIGKPEKVG